MPWTDKTVLVTLLGSTWAAGIFRVFLCVRNLVVAYVMVDVPPQFKGLKRKMRRPSKEETTVFQSLRSNTIEWSVVQVLRKLIHIIYVSLGLVVGYFPLLWSLTSGFSDSTAVQLVTYYALDGLISRTLMAPIPILTNFIGLGYGLDSEFLPTVGKSVYATIGDATCMLMLALTASYAPGGLRWILVPTANIVATLTDLLIWNLEMIYWRRYHLEPLHDKNINALAAEVGFPKDNVYCESTKLEYPVANYYSVFCQSWLVVGNEVLDLLSDDKEDCIAAHELGHWKHRWSTTQLLIRYILPLAETIGLGCLCAVAYGNADLNEVFGFAEESHPLIPMYLAYSYVWSVVSAPVHYLTMLLKRQSVFAADGFVLQQLGPKSVFNMKVALFRVAGLAEKYPIFDNWYSGLALGQPTILERLAHVDTDEYLNMLKNEGVGQLKQLT